jgi:chemotaxis protein CheD
VFSDVRGTSDARSPISDPADLIEVGIGELAIAKTPKRLMTPALGSCVAVALFDPFACRGGLVHVMLPHRQSGMPDDAPERFADTAIPLLVERLEEAGSVTRRLQAKIAGGAAMFHADGAIAGIGGRNVAEVKSQLALMSIPIMAEDTGEAHARTVEIDLRTGEFLVRSYQFGVKRL